MSDLLELCKIAFDIFGGRVANSALDAYLKKRKTKNSLKTLEQTLKAKYNDTADYYISEAIKILNNAPLNRDDFIKKHDFNVKKTVSALCDHHNRHDDDKDKIKEILGYIISNILEQRPNHTLEQLLSEQATKIDEILDMLKNNNFGLGEEEIKKLVRFYLAQDKSIEEIEQSIKSYDKLKQDFALLTGDSPEVKKAMDKAQNHIDNLQFDDAIEAIDRALSLENQDIARAEDNYRDIIINRAKKYELKGQIANQKFDFEQARDFCIDAYEVFESKLAPDMFNDKIRQIQSDYLHYITTTSLDAGLYHDDKTNHYAILAVNFAQQHFGDKNSNTLTSLNNLASLYEKQGRYDDAEPLYKEALEKSTDILGRDHPDTLTSLNSLALLYELQGRYDEAEPLYIEALEKCTEILGRDHPDTLTSVNNLAALYQLQGRYDEAEPLFIEALEKCTNILGRDHPDTLTSINNLAALYESQGLYDKSEPLYMEALGLKTNTLARDHPSTLNTINNLALLYKKQGRYDEAEPLFIEVLEKRTEILGRNHPDTLTSINNLASLYQAQGQYDKAEPLYMEALEKRTEILGRDHPSTLQSINNLAVLYAYQQRFKEAKKLFEEALAGRKKIFPNSHPDIEETEQSLAILKKLMDKNK